MVQFLLHADTNAVFVFAPLQGETAKKSLSAGELTADSLVLAENFKSSDIQITLAGQGAFRIFWLLGGGWSLLGLINFLPPFLYEWVYRLVAKNRHRLLQTKCIIPDPSFAERFLP